MSWRWIDNAGAFAELVDALVDEELVALDTEFHRERTYFPKVALVQLTSRNGDIALVDALAVDLAALCPLLDSDTLFVMHAAGQDLEVLQWACGVAPKRLFDTQLAAGFIGYSNPSLASLVDSALGIRLPKGDRLADWLRRPLSESQQSYAASDVEHLLPLYDWLSERLETEGRTEWVEDELAEMMQRQSVPRDPEEAWWRIKEARQLRGKAAGIAQTLAAWRERKASVVDQPARFVLPDLALVSIAQRPPSDVGGLRRVRGLDDRYLRGGAAAELVDAIEKGTQLRREDVKMPPNNDVDRDLRPAVTLVSAWVSQLGRDLRLDPTLVATRADIEALLQNDPSARLTRGWRAEVLGDDVRRLVNGEVALSFNGKGRLVLNELSAPLDELD